MSWSAKTMTLTLIFSSFLGVTYASSAIDVGTTCVSSQSQSCIGDPDDGEATSILQVSTVDMGKPSETIENEEYEMADEHDEDEKYTTKRRQHLQGHHDRHDHHGPRHDREYTKLFEHRSHDGGNLNHKHHYDRDQQNNHLPDPDRRHGLRDHHDDRELDDSEQFDRYYHRNLEEQFQHNDHGEQRNRDHADYSAQDDDEQHHDDGRDRTLDERNQQDDYSFLEHSDHEVGHDGIHSRHRTSQSDKHNHKRDLNYREQHEHRFHEGNRDDHEAGYEGHNRHPFGHTDQDDYEHRDHERDRTHEHRDREDYDQDELVSAMLQEEEHLATQEGFAPRGEDVVEADEAKEEFST